MRNTTAQVLGPSHKASCLEKADASRRLGEFTEVDRTRVIECLRQLFPVQTS